MKARKGGYSTERHAFWIRLGTIYLPKNFFFSAIASKAFGKLAAGTDFNAQFIFTHTCLYAEDGMIFCSNVIIEGF